MMILTVGFAARRPAGLIALLASNSECVDGFLASASELNAGAEWLWSGHRRNTRQDWRGRAPILLPQ
jgi:hypothetical protein